MSTKIHTFTVTLQFEDSIVSDNDMMEVAHNVAEAIKERTGGMGIAPEESGTYLTNVHVKHVHLTDGVNIKIV
jgi:hypothetical protein